MDSHLEYGQTSLCEMDEIRRILAKVALHRGKRFEEYIKLGNEHYFERAEFIFILNLLCSFSQSLNFLFR